MAPGDLVGLLKTSGGGILGSIFRVKIAYMFIIRMYFMIINILACFAIVALLFISYRIYHLIVNNRP